MFPGIYEATELAVARALTQSDYNKLENIFEKLLEFDDRIYKLHVWYAGAVSDEDIEKAFKHIDTAIEISPSQDNAYRLALLLAQKSTIRIWLIHTALNIMRLFWVIYAKTFSYLI